MSRRFALSVPVVALTLVGGGVAAPGTAYADDVVYATLSLQNNVVVYRGLPGFVNDSYVNWGNGTVPGPPTFMGDDYWEHRVAIDPSCGPNGSINGYPRCENGGMTPVVEVYLGDGNDEGVAGNSKGWGRLVTQYGEAGDDHLYAFETTDHLYGGPGHDRLQVDGQGSLGAAAVSSGDLASGGEGIDTLKTHDYSQHGMRITLDGVADDGDLQADKVTSAEGDNYLADIENVTGPTNAAAIVVATAAANSITTGAYDDSITPGAGTDTVVAGSGHDTIHAQDGEADKVDCGAGTDTVVADAQDTLLDCENITRPAPQPTPQPAPGAESSVSGPAKAATTSKGSRAGLSLSCSAGATRCEGRLRIRAKLGKKSKTIGSTSYSLASGAKTRVVVRLSRRAASVIRRRGRLVAVLRFSPTLGAGRNTRIVLRRG